MNRKQFITTLVAAPAAIWAAVNLKAAPLTRLERCKLRFKSPLSSPFPGLKDRISNMGGVTRGYVDVKYDGKKYPVPSIILTRPDGTEEHFIIYGDVRLTYGDNKTPEPIRWTKVYRCTVFPNDKRKTFPTFYLGDVEFSWLMNPDSNFVAITSWIHQPNSLGQTIIPA